MATAPQIVIDTVGGAHLRVVGILEIGRPSNAPIAVEGHRTPEGAVFFGVRQPSAAFSLVTTPRSLLPNTPLNRGWYSAVSTLELPKSGGGPPHSKAAVFFGMRQPSAAFSPGHDTQVIAAKHPFESGLVFCGIYPGIA